MGKITHDIDIPKIVYGSSLQTIAKLWKFGVDTPAKKIASRSRNYHIHFLEAVCEKECDELFLKAKARQQKNHPAVGILSTDPKFF